MATDRFAVAPAKVTAVAPIIVTDVAPATFTVDDKTGKGDFISTVSALSGMLYILVDRQGMYLALGLGVRLE